ncbi:disease resistance protein RPM1 [Vigna unguiculata]|uniref:Disease resistance protein RPM1 n=1 Tax=Vigna unguiculata TaxID=3917 RepID=A0A4D6LQ04_VIGUN|nr:disease resistance protein RPM1 [Vigna unguiculata]
MAEAVLKGVLGSLTSLAATELGSFLAFRGEKEKLESMFTAIKATLEYAEEKQFSDKAIKDWVGKLKDAAYELDDILDECVYEQLLLEEEEEDVRCCVSEMVRSSSLCSFHPKHIYFRYQIAKRMKILSERLDRIATERDQLRLTSMIQEETRGVSEWRQTFSLVNEPKVYGREEDIKTIVEFLAVQLRQCFAYCAIFLKDELIKKQYLIELWIANGFISSDGRLDAEDVGDEVWNELYRRSLFQDIETDQFGKVTSFKMHDLVHDLAQFVADEEICCITDEDCAPVLFERKRIHHLSDHRWNLYSAQLDQLTSLRTYLKRTRSKELSSDVLKCYSLRLLHVNLLEELSSSIGNLKYLTYLNLSRGRFKTLPESLCKLLNLKILKLDYCQSLQKLPDGLVRLKALQQLSLKVCRSLSTLPPYIGKVNSLRSLSMYFVGEQKGFLLSELGLLKLKRDLEIKHLERVKNINDAKESNMSSKQLNNLMLRWRTVREGELEGNDKEVLEALEPCTETLQSLRVEGYQGVSFPQWMSSPFFKNLTSLELWSCTNCIKLPVLRNLPSLKRLQITEAKYVKYVQEECYDNDVGFMGLEYLTLRNLPSLIRLSSEDGENQFPCLSTLDIEDCPHFSLQGLPSLKWLRMSRNPKLKVCPGLECLPCLEDLIIMRCGEVEGLQHMTALKKLALINVSKVSLLQELRFEDLPLLRELHIIGCYSLMRLPTNLSLSRLEA